jgi:hypothetical protein
VPGDDDTLDTDDDITVITDPGTTVNEDGSITKWGDGDVTPPVLTAGAVNRTSDATATVKFTSNEAGQYYYNVVDSGSPIPVSNATGMGTACGTAAQTISLSGLTAGAKDLYLVVKDAAGNVSSPTFKIAIPVYMPPPPPTTYAVTVTDGTGSASYEEGATVTITANAPAEGKVFDTWTSSGITLADPTNATTTFTMPANAVTVTATYKDDGADVTDTDGDGVPDDVEGQDGTDPNDPGDFKDTDEDGVPDYIETKDGTDPTDKNSFKDENSDGIPDYVQEHQEPLNEINGWVYANGAWKYYVDSVAKVGWLYDTNYKAWYYLDKTTAIMQTGWIYDQNTWYYLSGNGAMKTGWVKDDGSWYYLRGNGAMVWSKWLHDTDGSWYYLSGNGKMLTGTKKIGGKSYTFKTNGVWIG